MKLAFWAHKIKAPLETSVCSKTQQKFRKIVFFHVGIDDRKLKSAKTGCLLSGVLFMPIFTKLGQLSDF
jgi:hypothetical protein